MKQHHDRISEALEAIDAELGRPPITIEDSIHEAIEKGRMTPEEGESCLEAYQRSFDKSREIFG